MPSHSCSNRPSTPLSNSGIQTLSTGDSIIPSSVRPDGSTRKEIKVRPGYRPPEDQAKYRNRNVEIRDEIGKRGVPGLENQSTVVKAADEKNKNAKRREAAQRKAAAAAADAAAQSTTNETTKQNKNHTGGESETQALNSNETEKLRQDWRNPAKLVTNDGTPAAVEADETAEKEKKIRNLRKKLRQARDLMEKKEEGGELLPEQLAKVTKINELIRDLKKLGCDDPTATGSNSVMPEPAHDEPSHGQG
jgi:partner of Y14 and mago